MREKTSGDRPEVILDVEAHREARRVGRKRENEEADTLRKVRLEVCCRAAVADRLEDRSDLLGFESFVDCVRAKQRGKYPLGLYRGGVGAVRPKNGGGVADLDTFGATSLKKAVQRRRVGEGRRLRDRRIFALLMTVGGEGVPIK